MASQILFAGFKPKTLEPKNSIGAKWPRLLDRLDLASAVEGRRTAVKMHFGGGTGFTTIHPFFVRRLIGKLKDAGAREVFATDTPGAVRGAVERGYTKEVLGCDLVPTTGSADRFVYARPIDPPHFGLDEVRLAGEIVDAEAMIDFSHVKGHGDASFGGASKNLSMGAVDGGTRGKLHGIEGGLVWDAEKCDRCRICIENCPNGAMSFSGNEENEELKVFYHNCKLCQHCALICPNKAVRMEGGYYDRFQKGMALATAEVLKTFEPGRVLFINMLVNVTIYCDCWGMTTPDIVPDVGMLAGSDIVAVEQASLDMIETENLIPGSLPEGIELGGKGHLFERIHGKDPYVLVDHLAGLGLGSKDYEVVEVE